MKKFFIITKLNYSDLYHLNHKAKVNKIFIYHTLYSRYLDKNDVELKNVGIESLFQKNQALRSDSFGFKSAEGGRIKSKICTRKNFSKI